MFGKWEPMQIQLIYEDSVKKDSHEIVKRAVRRIEKRFEIIPIKETVELPICPDKHDAKFEFKGHFALWVSNAENDTECDRGTVAFAYNCILSPVDYRPLTAFLRLCPVWDEYSDAEKELTVLHEIFHGLGFAKEHFKNYPTSSRVKLAVSPFKFTMYPSQRDTAIFREHIRMRKGYGGWFGRKGSGVRIMKLGTNEATELARSHFGCDSLRGVELSRDGSHLSKIYFYDSFMSPVISGSSNMDCLISHVILEESGWYRIAKTGLHNGEWMAGVGCDIFNMNCLDYWVEHKDTEWFWFDSTDNCAIGEWNWIPKKFVYDQSHPEWGGPFGPEMEFCMIHKKYLT